MWSGNIQTGPVPILDIVVGVRPRSRRPPLRLATNPPRNPLLLKLLNVGEGGDGVTLTSPESDLVWSLLQG